MQCKRDRQLTIDGLQFTMAPGLWAIYCICQKALLFWHMPTSQHPAKQKTTGGLFFSRPPTLGREDALERRWTSRWKPWSQVGVEFVCSVKRESIQEDSRICLVFLHVCIDGARLGPTWLNGFPTWPVGTCVGIRVFSQRLQVRRSKALRPQSCVFSSQHWTLGNLQVAGCRLFLFTSHKQQLVCESVAVAGTAPMVLGFAGVWGTDAHPGHRWTRTTVLPD